MSTSGWLPRTVVTASSSTRAASAAGFQSVGKANGAPYTVGHSQAITNSSDESVSSPWPAAQSRAASEDGDPSTPTTIRPWFCGVLVTAVSLRTGSSLRDPGTLTGTASYGPANGQPPRTRAADRTAGRPPPAVI